MYCKMAFTYCYKSDKIMIQGVILKFEQIGQEEYKTVPYVKKFSDADRIGDILKWVKSVDDKKGIHDVYFTKPSK